MYMQLIIYLQSIWMQNKNKQKRRNRKTVIISEDITPLSVTLRTDIQTIGYRNCRKCEQNGPSWANKHLY